MDIKISRVNGHCAGRPVCFTFKGRAQLVYYRNQSDI